jgi:hypothetical protein
MKGKAMLLNCHLIILHYLQQYEKIKKPLISERLCLE